VGKNTVVSYFLLQFCNYKTLLTMNNQILRLETQTAALLTTIRELLNEDVLTAIDRDHLKHQCLLLYELILELPPVEDTVFTPPIQEPILPVVHESVPPVVQETIPPILQEETPPALFAEEPLKVTIQKPLFEEELTLNDLAKAGETTPVKLPETETEMKNRKIDAILDQQQKITPTPPATLDVELSLHEKIAHSMEPKTPLFEKLSAPVPSLKNAINVNLKIALVNHLFNENTVEYVKAIDKLNSCENIHEAMRYFNELKHHYSWDSDDYNVKELEQLLTKRYSG
jgi:hypothetical protein